MLPSRVLWIQPEKTEATKHRSSAHIHHHNRRTLLPLFLLSVVLTLNLTSANFRPKVKVISGGNSLASSGFSGRGKILENSPIYYLKVGNAGLRNGNKNPHLSSSSFLSPSPSPSSSLMLSGVSLKRRVNSNLYKLPLSFVSNAKPVEIIQGK